MQSAAIIKDAVYRTIESLNDLLPPEQALEPSDDVVLVGRNAVLDSMGFVNFIVALEEELESRLGRPLNIADLLLAEMPDRGSVSTVADLVDVLSQRLE